MIGANEEMKPINEAVNLNENNLFEYIGYIMNHRNADLFGSKSTSLQEQADTIINSCELSSDIKMNIIDLYMESMCECSHYAFESGFREGIRLLKTLLSM